MVFFVLSPKTAYANSLIPTIYITFPTFEILLISVIAIEALMFEKLLNLDRKNAFKISCYANIVSTAVGFPLRWLIYSDINPVLVFRESRLNLQWKTEVLEPETIYRVSLIYGALFAISVIIEAGVVFISLRKTHSGRIFIAVFKANAVSYSIVLFAILRLLTIH